MLNGVINIYKEKGFTSHDVVAKARGILRERKIGHTGTLDPEAEGVLPICIGNATKVVPYLTDADKCYEAEVILGTTTTTEDATGEIVDTKEVNVSRVEIEEVVKSFIGDYMQTPPMYSAIKINGTRLYELARKGIIIDRPSRKVNIFSCDIIEWIDSNRFKIRVSCSKGTYIRTLCTDIGDKLKCGAHMGALLRIKVGNFTLQDSITLKELEAYKDTIESYITPVDTLFGEYPIAKISEVGQKRLVNGNALRLIDFKEINKEASNKIIRVNDINDKFSALYKWEDEKQCFVVEKMFNIER